MGLLDDSLKKHLSVTSPSRAKSFRTFLITVQHLNVSFAADQKKDFKAIQW